MDFIVWVPIIGAWIIATVAGVTVLVKFAVDFYMWLSEMADPRTVDGEFIDTDGVTWLKMKK